MTPRTPTLKMKFCSGCGSPILRNPERRVYILDYCNRCREEMARRHHARGSEDHGGESAERDAGAPGDGDDHHGRGSPEMGGLAPGGAGG